MVRLVTFAALAGYGLVRWATLMRPQPGWRLLGLLALAVAMAGAVPLVARVSRAAGAGVSVVILLLAFPVSGLRWHWLRHMSIARTADRIEHGLSLLPNALIPYLGPSHDVRLVIVLGAAVLVLDAAAVLAFAPGPLGDGRRAAAALPLIALAVVPSTLIRPELPYMQGLVLFGLLAAFMWGERVRAGADRLRGRHRRPGRGCGGDRGPSHRPRLAVGRLSRLGGRPRPRPRRHVQLEPDLRTAALAPERPRGAHRAGRQIRRLLEGRGSRHVQRLPLGGRRPRAPTAVAAAQR